MNNAIKSVQYFIHKHYILIKLLLLAVILVLVSATYYNSLLAEQRRVDNDERINQELIALARDIDSTQQKQHDHQDERQACFFNLFISYVNTSPRQPITQDDADKCRVAGSDTTVFPASNAPSKSATQTPTKANTSEDKQDSNKGSDNQSGQKSNGLLGLCPITTPLPVLGGVLVPVVGCES